MKATVKEVFVDKFDSLKQYSVGEVIEIADKSRLKDLVERGLVVASLETVETPKVPLKKTVKKEK